MRFVRGLMTFFKIIFGLVYILSGFLKFVDPVGTGLIVEEYLQVMHLNFLRFGALPFGIVLSVCEFLIGISILTGIRIKITSLFGLLFSSFFTILTFFMAIFDAIPDCGCFGEAIHLTMWETFFKNVILTLLIIPIFIFRNNFKKVASAKIEWSFMIIYAIFAIYIPIYSVINLPLAEFGNFKVGTDLSVKMEELADTSRFKTFFIYEKGGVKKSFGLNNLPDDSWTFVNSESRYEGNESNLLFDMSITDMNGKFISEEITNSTAPIFLFSACIPEKLNNKYWKRVANCMDSLFSAGCIPYLLVPFSDKTVSDAVKKYPLLSKSLAFADYKTLISIVRSNGGVVYLNKGLIVRKWPERRFNFSMIKPLLSKDAEELTARGSINEHIFYEISILFILIISIIFRYVCGFIWGEPLRKRKMTRSSSDDPDENIGIKENNSGV